MLREIVLDTETTGLDPDQGHRIVEVAALELVNHLPTGRTFHSYVNPQRDMPEEAFRVHGLSAAVPARLSRVRRGGRPAAGVPGRQPADHPQRRLRRPLPHAELTRHALEPLAPGRAIDTLLLAQRRFPGTSNSLDALCRRFAVDNAARTLHGALLDCELLAEVYLHLIGGRQTMLGLERPGSRAVGPAIARPVRPPRPHAPSPEELAAHAAFVAKLDDPIWLM